MQVESSTVIVGPGVRGPVQEREKRQAHGRALAAAAKRQAAAAAAQEASEAGSSTEMSLKDIKH